VLRPTSGNYKTQRRHRQGWAQNIPDCFASVNLRRGDIRKGVLHHWPNQARLPLTTKNKAAMEALHTSRATYWFAPAYDMLPWGQDRIWISGGSGSAAIGKRAWRRQLGPSAEQPKLISTSNQGNKQHYRVTLKVFRKADP